MKRFLRLCAEVESTVEKAYQALAKKTEEPELKAMWLQLANDEADHANQLLLAERLAAGDSFPGQNMATEKVRLLLKEAQDFLTAAQGDPMAPFEALKTSILLEKKFMDVHVNNAIVFSSDSLRKTFDALGRSDEAHFETLKAYLRRHKDELLDPA